MAGLRPDPDVSLALPPEGPALGNAPGVAFAGSALWLTEPLMRRLRDEVADGLRAASFGADAFRRSVRLAGDMLVDPSRRRRVDAFGETTTLLRTSAAPLTVFEDGLALFENLDSFIGDFTGRAVQKLTTPRHDRHRGATPASRMCGFRPRGRRGDSNGTAQWSRELAEAR